ncbi:MAG: hypothetical protein JRH20_09965 [Deltaproteobacteria bacterium]|nr:hypothetical protein [Deltaproteobacteria bacterium]
MSSREKESIFCCRVCRLWHSTEVKRCRHCGEASPRPLGALLVTKQKWKLQRRNRRRRSFRPVDLLFIILLILTPFEIDRRDPVWTMPVIFALLGAWALVRVVHALVVRYQWVRIDEAPTVSDVERGLSLGRETVCVGGARRLKGSLETGGLAGGGQATRCFARESWLALSSRPSRLRLRRSKSVPFIVDDGSEAWVVQGVIRLTGASVASSEGASFPAKLAAPWTEGSTFYELQVQSRDRVAISGGLQRRDQVDPRPQRKADASKVNVAEGIAGDPVWVTVLKKGGPAG